MSVTNGTLYTNYYDNQRLVFSWTKTSEDRTNLTTKIHWTLTCESPQIRDTLHNIQVRINSTSATTGTQIYYREEITPGGYTPGQAFTSGDYTIQHESDGTKTFSVYAECGTYYQTINTYGTESYELPAVITPITGSWTVDDPSETSFRLNYTLSEAPTSPYMIVYTSVNDVHLDKVVTVSTSASSGSVTVVLGGSYAGKTVSISKISVLKGSLTCNISGSGSLTLWEYPKGGDVADFVIGEQPSTFNIYNPHERTVTVDVIGAVGLIKTATTSGTSVNINFTDQELYSHLPQSLRYGEMLVRVTYGTSVRSGAAGRYSIPSSYNFPTLTSTVVTRCNSSGTDDPMGVYAKLNYSYTSTYTITTPTVFIYDGSTQILTKACTVSGNTISAIVGTSATQLSISKRYTATLSIQDNVAEWTNRPTTLSVTIPSSSIPMSLYEDASGSCGVSFGRQASSAGYDFYTNSGNWPIKIDGTYWLNLVYPVGSIYMSVNSTSPVTLFGGTWSRIQDRFLLAASSSYAVNSTGGSATHTPSGTVGGHALTVDEMPSHAHEQSVIGNRGSTSGEQRVVTWNSSNLTANYGAAYNYTFSAGGGSAHNHGFTGTSQDTMPPYLAVYMWKRTA